MQHIDWLLTYVREVCWTKSLINIPKRNYQQQVRRSDCFDFFFAL